MSDLDELRRDLERRLTEIPGVAIGPWKDTDLICLFFHGREFAHFHGDLVLDIRLSQKIIRQEALSRAVSARIHPARSPNSRWICVELSSAEDLAKTLRLVDLACKELG
ncbi:MAG: luciferase family protein [Pseudomonadota bacterium]